MRVVAISDTHGLHDYISVPEGDVLIHAGDFMNFGTRVHEISRFNVWLGKQPHKHKIVIAGNHDILFEKDRAYAQSFLSNATHYLQDDYTIIDGVKFYGSPWTPEFMHWAFMLPRKGSTLQNKWDQIPLDTDVLITHGPPRSITDKYDDPEEGVMYLGDELLLGAVHRVRPRFHIYGHIHSGAPGSKSVWGTEFYNAAQLDEKYQVRPNPVVFEVEK